MIIESITYSHMTSDTRFLDLKGDGSMKKLMGILLMILIIGACSIYPVFAVNGVKATFVAPEIYVNGARTYYIGYEINGDYYFMLRDIAMSFRGTSSKLNIKWNSEKKLVEIITGQDYTDDGSLTTRVFEDSYTAYPTTATLLSYDKVFNVKGYRIDGNNFFKLKDLENIISCQVDRDEKQNAIYITTKLPEGAAYAKSEFQLTVNAVLQSFPNTAGTKRSYLFANSDGTIGAVDIRDKVNIDTYDLQYKHISSKSIDFELPIFGAFYSGNNYNYIVYGQENREEDDNKEVIRIVKYNKDFTRVDSASVKGGESFTIVPFYASSGEMAEKGNELVFHSSRLRYKTEDGLNHQSQLTIILDTDTMTVVNHTGEYQPNHVSHSFNQLARYDDTHVLLDHGDGAPRSIVLNKQKSAHEYAAVDLFKIPGEFGDNYTGVSIGGFEVSTNSYIAVINSIDHGYAAKETGSNEQRDVILCTVPKDKLDSSYVEQVKITEYIGTDRYPSIPALVKINDDMLMVLWQEIYANKSFDIYNVYGDVKYMIIDGRGNPIGSVQTLSDMTLSSCNPILLGDKVIWYTNQNNNRVFYTIPTGDKL